MELKLNGMLNQNNNNFIIHSPISSPTQQYTLPINLTDILNKIYCNDDNFIDIKIFNAKNGKTVYSEQGLLYYSKVLPKKYILSVEGEDLENILINNIGNYLEIIISSEVLERTTINGTAESKG